MNEKMRAVHELVAEIYATQPVELFCDQASVLIARAADSRLTDAELQKLYPDLWQHFNVCPNCTAVYDLTMELARTDELPSPEQIPPLPTRASAPNSFWQWFKESITTQFPGFQPAVSLAIQRGLDSLQMEPVSVDLGGDFEISFDVTQHEADTSRRDLLCTLFVAGDSPIEQFEGCAVWLQQDDNNLILQEQTLDNLGDVMFTNIEPGKYNLLLHLAKQKYLITDVMLP